MSSFRDDAPPWSFFIPVTLAVIVGVLAADAIRHAIGIVFDRDEAPAQVETEAGPAADPVAAPERAEPVSPPTPGPAAAADATDVAASPRQQAATAVDAATSDSGVLELPDSMTARRDGAPRACVNGTVVNRVEGGWEQALEGNATVACVIVNR